MTLEEDGALVLPVGLEPSMVSRLAEAVSKLESGEGIRRRGDVYAVRNLIALAPDVLEPLSLPLVRSLVAPVLGPRFFAVDGILSTPRRRTRARWGAS